MSTQNLTKENHEKPQSGWPAHEFESLNIPNVILVINHGVISNCRITYGLRVVFKLDDNVGMLVTVKFMSM